MLLVGSLGLINFSLIIIWFFRVVINFGAGMREKSMPFFYYDYINVFFLQFYHKTEVYQNEHSFVQY